MLPQEKRQNEIMKQLQKDKSVKISQISQKLNVTRETIRRDIYNMSEKNLVKKIHGGAVLNKTNYETAYDHRKDLNTENKINIAKKAAEVVENDDTVYIDYGTTALFFAREILNKKNLTIITNSLPIANEVTNYTNFETIIMGGHVRRNEKSLYGPIASRTIENLFIDKGFFSVSGVDLHAGYTNAHMGEAWISKQVMSHCQKKIMMVDSSKFNSVGMNQVALIDEVDILVTDPQLQGSVLKDLYNLDVSVLLANTQEEGDYD